MKIILTPARALELLESFERVDNVPPADLLAVTRARASAIIDHGTIAAWEAGLQRPTANATPGERGYESYRESIGGSFNGVSLPPFSKIPERIQSAWEVAAAAILQKSESTLDPRSPDHIATL